jgi:hypothetical protein
MAAMKRGLLILVAALSWSRGAAAQQGAPAEGPSERPVDTSDQLGLLA